MSLGEILPENLPKALAEALAKSLAKTGAEPPPNEGVISRQWRLVNSEFRTYRKERHDALDKNPYHATRIPGQDFRDHKVLCGLARGPQFFRGGSGPETAPG